MATIMAGILGLVAVIIRPAIDGLGKCIGEPIKRKFKYLCCFNDNVKDLESEAKKLGDALYDVQSRVDIAQNNAQIVTPQVLSWLDEVNEIQIKKPEFDTTKSGVCSTLGCGNYSVSKKVKEMAEAMKELRQESDAFTIISHPPPPEAMVPINIGSSIVFDSRKRVEDEIMSSLRDEGTNKVGICGMGGVGKTTMAKTIMRRAREELGFEEIVMAVVSQDVDKLKIQADIAKSLGLTLGEGSLSSKAHELRTRLSAGTRRSLVVIDDVWEKLELEELGIPCNSGCKVVITSRNSHILEAMDVEKLHTMQVLFETEAWELFKSKTGSCIEQQNVAVVAGQVVDECKGLPLALVTVGVALKNKANVAWWNTALQQLQSANPRHMPEVIKYVYQPLKLSYDFLESDEQKSLFLMCCLFSEDRDIPLETLTIFCIGLHMYEDITSLEQARATTCLLVERLKSRFLLINGSNENHVRMHDVVRDVAIFIAAEERRIKCNECIWISPNIGETIGAHGESSPSPFPNLRLLWIDGDSINKDLYIHKDLFVRMRKLKVIMIKNSWLLQRLPEKIGLLNNLRTLVLEYCDSLESISAVGELVNLEILICHYCDRFESLPVEIRNLRQLRLLELSGCWKLKTIPPGIISNLRELEELIVEHFGGWEARIVEGERKNAPLCELEHLSKLTRLEIAIKNTGLAAESFNLPPNLLKFHITFGGKMDDMKYDSSWEKKMKLELSADVSWGNFLKECVGKVEHMEIMGDSSSVLDLRQALNLRLLDIRKCSTVKKLVTNCPLLEILYLEEVGELEEIGVDIQHSLASNFKNLSSIIIERCGSLRRLFPSSSLMGSGGCFPRLERLEIRDCSMMEQVFMWNEDQTNIIHIPPLRILFPKLNYIELVSLPRLTCFIKGIQAIEFPQLDEMHIGRCLELKELVYSGSSAYRHGFDNDFFHLSCHPYKVKFCNLSKLRIFGVRSNFCLQAPIDSFAGLSELELTAVHGVKRLFSFSRTESSCLAQLEKLNISWCCEMEEVISWKEEEVNKMDAHMITLFPNLMDLSLVHLESLTNLSKGIENIIFHVPPKMYIDNCPLLESCDSEIADTHLFCNPHHKVEFDRLKDLEISGSRPWEMRWCPQIPMIELFRGVCRLAVTRSTGMKTLFPCLIAQMMHNITVLWIEMCDEMVRVIEDKVDACETTPPILLFPKLKSLRLYVLPVLRSFCEWRCGLELPSLLNLEITNCDMMVELTSGPLYTPNLQTMELEHHILNGIDVSSPLRLSSLRKQAEKEKYQELGAELIVTDEASSSMQAT